MMRMTLALNKNNFGSRRDVTCYSCHRGSQRPASIPSVASDIVATDSSNSVPNAGNASSLGAGATPPLPINLPTVSEIVDRSISAMGGAAAIQQLRTCMEEGTITNRLGTALLQILSAAPSKQVFARHLARGDATTIVNGDAAWFVMPGRPANLLRGAELDAARLDADLQFPLHLRETFPELRREYPETLNGRDAWLLIGERDGFPPIKFYFDQQTGLLVRQIRYADSAIGSQPTQIDYSDFHVVDKIQFPHRIAISQPNSREVIVWTKIIPNYPMNGTRFEPPRTSTTRDR